MDIGEYRNAGGFVFPTARERECSTTGTFRPVPSGKGRNAQEWRPVVGGSIVQHIDFSRLIVPEYVYVVRRPSHRLAREV